MVACDSCGYRNEEGDTFCGSCGAYMGWTQRPSAAAGPTQQVLTDTAVSQGSGGSAPPVATAAPPTPAERSALEAEIDAGHQDELRRAEQEAEAQRAREAAAAAARLEAEARARDEQEAAARAREAAESEERARVAAQEQAARQAEAAAQAEAKAHERELAEARALAERTAREAAEAADGASAEAQARDRAHAEALARAEAERLAAQEALAAAEAKAAEEARARQEAELAAQSAVRQKEEADARAAAQARAAADAEAARAAAEADAAKMAEAARQAEAARRAASLVARLPAKSDPVAAPVAAPPGAVAPGSPPPAATSGSPGAPAAVLPGAPQPVAVKPGMPMRQREERPAEQVKEYHHGDLICGQCGDGNLATRKFCRTCGTTLAEATVHKVAWWRRLFTRDHKAVAAGTRPQRDAHPRSASGRAKALGGGLFRSGKRAVLALIVIAVAVVALVPPLRHEVTKRTSSAYTTARQTVSPRYVPVHPVAATAPFGSAPGSDPLNAIDGNTATHWASAAHPPPIVLVVKFKEESTIRKIGLTLGDQDDPANFAKQPRPRDIHLVYVDSAGKKVGGHDLTVKDVQTFQTFGINARKTASIEIHINSLYSSIDGDSTSLAEAEFFTRS